MKQIQSEHENSISLSDGKIDTSNECFYIVEYNLRKLNELIEQFKKNLNNNSVETVSSQKTTVPSSQIDETYQQTITTTSKIYN